MGSRRRPTIGGDKNTPPSRSIPIAVAATLELEVDRLKKLVVELLLDKQMLQDIAKKKW